MITAEQLQNLHKLVWDFRGLASEFWPTPSPDDALRYAFTEAGEAMDALLREKRPNDKRNRDKDQDRLDEWADCAIMLMTALRDVPDYGPTLYLAESVKVVDEILCFRVADHLRTILNISIEQTVALIAVMPGMNLQSRIVERLRRIMHKHVPPYRWDVVEAALRPYVVFDHTKV